MDEGDLSGLKTQVRLLGPVQLLAGSRVVPVGGPGVRGLLALLALEANRVVGLDEIIDALWAHDPPATARTIVHGNVSQLRRVLRSVQSDEDDARILTAPPGYQLRVDPQQIDVHRARILMDRAASAAGERRAELLSEAYSLWQGPVLAGVPDSIRAPELEELRLAVHGARVDADLAIGRHNALIVELSPIVRVNPFAERTVGQLMRALYFAGRRGDALELYQRVSAKVVGTLGIDPGPELRRLHDRVLNDDLPEPRAPVETAPSPPPTAPSQIPAGVPSLAGRAAELTWLDQGLSRAAAGESVVAVVTGSAGIGKSALVVSWAHKVAKWFPDGVLFAALRGFDPHQAPFEAADVLTQFLLGLGVPTADVPEQVHERVALYRSLIARRRMLVLLDDARTAEQVRPLLPPGAHSMAVVTSRSRLEGLAVSHAARLRALDTLAPDAAVKLIEELAGPSNYDLNHALAKLCGYLPLALRIASARLASGPQWTARELVDEMSNERTRLAALDVDGSETSVRAALDVSFRDLSPQNAEVFRLFGVLTCAVVGPHLVAELCGTDVRDARRRLRTLAGHNLLTESARDAFSPHDLVRLYLRDLAETELSRQQRGEMLAGSVRYYQAVADRARRTLLRIVDPLDFTGLLPGDRAPEFAGFEDAQSWFDAEWPNLLATLDAAAAAGLHEDVWRLARITHTYRVVCPLWHEWTRLVEIGLVAARTSGSELGLCWMLISRCALKLTFEQLDGSLADAEAAVGIAAALGDDRLISTAGIHLGGALTLGGRYDEAIERLGAVVAETERTGDLALRGQALNNRAEAEKRAGRYPEAITHQLVSLQIDRELGDDSYVATSLNNLAELNLKLGELDEAERYAWQVIELAASRQLTLQEGVSRATLARTLREKGDVAGAHEQFALSRELCAHAGAQRLADS